MNDDLMKFLDSPITIEEALDRVQRRLKGSHPGSTEPDTVAVEVLSKKTSRGTPLKLSHIEEEAEVVALTVWANHLEDFSWCLLQFQNQAVKNTLRLAKLGIRDQYWLSPAVDRDVRAGFLSRYPVTRVETYGPASLLAASRTPKLVIDAIPVRLVTPVLSDPDRLAIVRAGGESVELMPGVTGRYSMSEIGPIAISCPKNVLDYHVLSQRVELFEDGRVRSTLPQPRGQREFFTGDVFDLHEDACGCKLDELGLTKKVTNIRRASHVR